MRHTKRYRERTVEYWQAGHSLETTHQTFRISKSTIQKWKKQLEETGNLEKNALHRSFRKIAPEKLKAYVAEHPDVCQSEMAGAFGCGIRDALRRHSCNTACMNVFLKQLSEQYPDAVILLCCDSAAWHKSGGLNLPNHIVFSYPAIYA